MIVEEEHENKHTDNKDLNPSHFNWTETLLSDFGFKCLMNKHDLCDDDKCRCLCHPHNQK